MLFIYSLLKKDAPLLVNTFIELLEQEQLLASSVTEGHRRMQSMCGGQTGGS